MLKIINSHLLDHVDLHDDIAYKIGLFDNWYESNFINLISAIKNTDGFKVLLDINSFHNLENYCKKLFLLTDVIVLRDAIQRIDGEFENVFMPIAESAYLDKQYIDVDSFPPIVISPPQGCGNWTGSKTLLNNGEEAQLAWKFASFFSRQVYDWILSRNGRKYIETGQIAYAPFIPPINVELEFLKKGFNVSESFDVQTLYCNEYDWLNENHLYSILNLNIPTVEYVDIETLKRIKDDNYDSYQFFRNDLLASINQIKSSMGTADFHRELRYIQKNRIDDNLDKLNIEMKKLKRMSALRKVGLTLGVIGLDFSFFDGTLASIPILETAALGIEEAIATLQEKGQLKTNPSYFLWKVKNSIK